MLLESVRIITWLPDIRNNHCVQKHINEMQPKYSHSNSKLTFFVISMIVSRDNGNIDCTLIELYTYTLNVIGTFHYFFPQNEICKNSFLYDHLLNTSHHNSALKVLRNLPRSSMVIQSTKWRTNNIPTYKISLTLNATDL